MKTYFYGIALILIIQNATADIAVEFDNTSGFYTTGDNTTYVDQAIAQLIWSSSAPDSSPASPWLPSPGEYILDQVTTTSGFSGTWSDKPQVTHVYTQTDVGGNNINSGYLFVRVFDSTYTFRQTLTDIETTGVLTEYDSFVSSTIYKTDGSLGGNLMGIPEPSTVSLLGISGLTLFIMRKRTRQ